MVKKSELEKNIIQKKLEIADLEIKVQEKDKLIFSLKKKSKKQSQIESYQNDHNKIKVLLNSLEEHKITISQFKSSIVYPFYNITHKIGKTRIGKILQKLLK